MTTTFNQYEIQNAAEKVDGYFLNLSTTEQGGRLAEFQRAQDELLIHLRHALACAEALTFEQFLAATKRKTAAPGELATPPRPCPLVNCKGTLSAIREQLNRGHRWRCGRCQLLFA